MVKNDKHFLSYEKKEVNCFFAVNCILLNILNLITS